MLAGTANTQDKAVAMINELNPDLVLLDVELHGGNGFEVLIQTADENYNVVFTTALFDEALHIIILSGVPVLQKPLDYDELKNVLGHFGETKYVEIQTICLQNLRHTLNNNHVPDTIALKCNDGLYHINLEKIIKAVSEEGKLSFFLENGTILHPIKDIKYYEMLLSGFGFFRVNVNALVNLSHVNTEHSAGENIRLSDGSKIDLSPKKREAFLESLTPGLPKGRDRLSPKGEGGRYH